MLEQFKGWLGNALGGVSIDLSAGGGQDASARVQSGVDRRAAKWWLAAAIAFGFLAGVIYAKR